MSISENESRPHFLRRHCSLVVIAVVSADWNGAKRRAHRLIIAFLSRDQYHLPTHEKYPSIEHIFDSKDKKPNIEHYFFSYRMMMMLFPNSLRPLVSLLLLSSSSLVPILSVMGWNIAINVTTHANGAVGGRTFAIQPVVAVTDGNEGMILQHSFEGRVAVRIDPSSFATDAGGGRNDANLWKEGETTAASGTTLVSQSVMNGRAIFTGLGIDTAGSRYRLKFILYDEHDLIMDTAVSDEFDVIVGDAYQLGWVTHPESAFGGSVFGSQPLVSIQDRGGNTVTDVNEGMVRNIRVFYIFVRHWY